MSQSLVKNYIHLIFSTKDRSNSLPKSHLSEIHSYIAEIFKNNHCPIISVRGTYNHVHILFCLDKSKALSDIVRIVKSSVSHWINSNYGTKLSIFAWQDGYGAFSISKNHVQVVTDYINNQEEHHKKISFQDEFRRICKLYKVGINEQYVWS